MFIRVILSTVLGVVPASSIGCVIGIEWLGAFALQFRSPVGAVSFVMNIELEYRAFYRWFL